MPKQSHYDSLEVDEFWTYVGNKKKKVWLIYAYHRETGEIVAFVWGKRNRKTANRLRDKLKLLGVCYDTIYTDNWDSFVAVFKEDNHIIGKENPNRQWQIIQEEYAKSLPKIVQFELKFE